MYTLDKLDWEILNATADDGENLEQIYRQICFELVEAPNGRERANLEYRPIAGAPSLSEIANRICSLVNKGWLTPVCDENGRPLNNLDDLGYVWQAWFSMTSEGKKIWDSSEYLIEQE